MDLSGAHNMQIQTLILGSLDTNTYLAIDEITNDCLIIDPADAAQTIADEILAQNLTPIAIIATHGHYDHLMAASELQLNFNLPFMIHERDEFLVKELNQRASRWLQRPVKLQPPKITDFLENDQVIELGETVLKVLPAPGHTPGGICLMNDQEKVVFTGDTLFAEAVGRTDLPYSSATDLSASLKKLKARCQGYDGYPGHGQKFIVA